MRKRESRENSKMLRKETVKSGMKRYEKFETRSCKETSWETKRLSGERRAKVKIERQRTKIAEADKEKTIKKIEWCRGKARNKVTKKKEKGHWVNRGMEKTEKRQIMKKI